MSNQNGLLSSKDVAATGDVDSNFFIRKGETIIVDDIIANNITCDTLDLNGGLLTTTTGGTVLTLNGVPITGGVATITGTAPINVTSGANPVVSLNDTAVVPATYTLATVTVDSKGRITSASSNTVPPNDDWSNFPAQTAVNMNNFKITTLATPTVATDASTKGYVDSNFVALTGNQTISGIKTFNSIPVCATLPTNNDQLANKQYVDAAVGADALVNVLIAGNSAGANQINMNSNKIINCADPTLAQDVATKAYVDARPTETLAATLIAGNSAGANQINMNSNKIINLATPTLTTDAVTKEYADGVITTVPTLTTVMNAGNVAPRDLDMNDFDISSVNDITMSGLAPTITATNVLGNMILSASNTMNLATIGQMTLASGGILSLGGATYTTLEDIRITDNAITKESGAADITIADVASITNTGTMLIQADQDLTLNSTSGSVNVESVNVSGTTVSATSGGNNFSLSPTELLIAGGTQLSNTQTANNITLLNFIPGVGGGVGRVEAQADLGQAQLFLGCGVGTPGDQNTFRLTVAPSTGAIMEHETLVGTNRALTVRSEGQLNLQAGYNDTGATTTKPITITSTGQGGQANPTITLTNTNTTGSVALEIYKNKPTAGANGDVLYTQAVYGKDSANTKQEYTRITHTIRDATAGAEDGSMELGCFVNGVNTNFIALNGNDAPIGEVNISRPLDFIGGSDANATIKTSGTGSVNLNLDATTSDGTGAIALKTKNGVAGSGGGLLLTGNTLLSGSAGANSGQHLCLTINGVAYKINLFNP